MEYNFLPVSPSPIVNVTPMFSLLVIADNGARSVQLSDELSNSSDDESAKPLL